MGDSQHALKFFTSRELQQMDIPPLRFIVDGLLPEGLSLLIAPPKYGKSWFSLQLCAAVAQGIPFLGFQTVQGSVLYLALEDSPGRLKRRQEAFLQGRDAPENFYIATTANPIGGGLEGQISAFIQGHPDTVLIVVDVLAKIRPTAGRANVNVYYGDYQDMAPLKELADKYHVCMLVLHHYRKSQDDSDFLNNASGSNGISGSADTIIGINKPARESESATLLVTGRDVEMQTLPILFDKQTLHWKRTTAAPEDSIPAVVRMVLHVMQGRDSWQGTPAQMLAECSGLPFVRLITDPRSIGKSLTGVRAEINGNGIDWNTKRNSSGQQYSFFRLRSSE